MSLSSSNHTDVQDWDKDRLGWAVSGSKVTDVISVGQQMESGEFCCGLHASVEDVLRCFNQDKVQI